MVGRLNTPGPTSATRCRSASSVAEGAAVATNRDPLACGGSKGTRDPAVAVTEWVLLPSDDDNPTSATRFLISLADRIDIHISQMGHSR